MYQFLLWGVIPDNKTSTIVRFFVVKGVLEFEAQKKKQAEQDKIAKKEDDDAIIKQVAARVLDEIEKSTSDQDSQAQGTSPTNQTPTPFFDIINKKIKPQ